MIFARLDKREKRLNAHKTGKEKKVKKEKIGQTCNRNVERWEKHFEAATTAASSAKSHALAKKFKQTITKSLLYEGKGANIGETDPEKAIVIEGRRGKQTRNE